MKEMKSAMTPEHKILLKHPSKGESISWLLLAVKLIGSTDRPLQPTVSNPLSSFGVSFDPCEYKLATSDIRS